MEMLWVYLQQGGLLARACWGRGHFYHVGIDIVTKELVFSTFLGNELVSWSSCQSATVTHSRGQPVVIIVTSALGVYAIGQKYDQVDSATTPVVRNATMRIPP